MKETYQYIKGKTKMYISWMGENCFTEKAFYLYVISFMIIIPVFELLFETYDEAYTSQPIIVGGYGCIGIVMYAVHFLKNKKEFKWCMSDVFYLILFLFAILSLVFSCDIEESVLGIDYDEPIEIYVAYFSLMFAATMIRKYEYRRNILYTFLWMVFIEGGYGVLQSFGITIAPAARNTEANLPGARIAYGLTQNSNFYGALTVMMFAAVLGKYLFDKEKVFRNIYMIGIMIGFYALLASNARSAWVGAIAIFLFYIVAFLVMHKHSRQKKWQAQRKRLAAAFLMCVGVIGVFLLLSNNLQTSFMKTEYEMEVGEIDRLGSGRIGIYKQGLKSIPKHWLTGVGLDNYIYTYKEDPAYGFEMGEEEGTKKAHNELLHIAVTQGVPAGIAYLLLWIYVVTIGVKTVIEMKDDNQTNLTWIFLGMAVGYMAQAMFNCSVPNVASYFWIALGCVMPRDMQKQHLYMEQQKKA